MINIPIRKGSINTSNGKISSGDIHALTSFDGKGRAVPADGHSVVAPIVLVREGTERRHWLWKNIKRNHEPGLMVRMLELSLGWLDSQVRQKELSDRDVLIKVYQEQEGKKNQDAKHTGSWGARILSASERVLTLPCGRPSICCIREIYWTNSGDMAPIEGAMSATMRRESLSGTQSAYAIATFPPLDARYKLLFSVQDN